MRENEVEKRFVAAVRAVGGQALKFTSQSMNGVPDRLVLLIGGKCAFVELKAPGKQMRILQRKRRQQLEALGFPVFCVECLYMDSLCSHHAEIQYLYLIYTVYNVIILPFHSCKSSRREN